MSEAGGSPPPRSQKQPEQRLPAPQTSLPVPVPRAEAGWPPSLPSPTASPCPPRAHTGLSLPGPSDVAEREQCDVLSALLAGIKTQQRNKKTH